MTREAFDDLVRRVEEGVGRRPAQLRARALLWAAVGYAGLLAGGLLVLAISALFIIPATMVPLSDGIVLYLLGTAILVFGGWHVLKAWYVVLQPPEGQEITRAEAPVLFAVLDELQGWARSAPFHRVLLIAECNAAVVQVPRLGVLGWPRNYLLLGLPLMESLSPEELRAVLAHEFAHLSASHGSTGQWLYRLRRSWERIFEKMSGPQLKGELSLRRVSGWFVAWFWPYFNAHAFVLSRANEYEADHVGGVLTTPGDMASALVRNQLVNRLLGEQFWPDLWLRANSEPVPPDGVFLQLAEKVRSRPADADAARWLAQSFAAVTTNADTHPSLTDRLRSLHLLPANGASPSWPTPPARSAAEAFFGPGLPAARQAVEAFWKKTAAKNWRERHHKAASLNDRLSLLEQSVSGKRTDVDGLWDKAAMLVDLEGDEKAEPWLREILNHKPDHAGANYYLGRRLLSLDDPQGEAHLERAMRASQNLVAPGSGLLHSYYRRTGQTNRLRELAVRLDQQEHSPSAADRPPAQISNKDRAVSHGLSEAELVSLRQLLEQEGHVVAANLGRRRSDAQTFLLCLTVRRPWYQFLSDERERAAISRLMPAVQLPGRVFIFAKGSGYGALFRQLSQLPDAEVYRRAG